MKYRQLSSISYEDLATYNAEYERRFEGADTIQFPLAIHDMPAFLVNVPQITNLIADIYRSTMRLQQLEYIPEIAIDFYIRRCLIEEVQASNNMEGVHSTYAQLAHALDSKRPMRFQGIVKKYNVLFHRPQPGLLGDKQSVRNLYDELFADEIEITEKPDGQFFRGKDRVFVKNIHQKIVHEGIFPEEKVNKTMDAALSILTDDEIPCLIRMAAFHYFFGYIHPFYDGNGRMGRFISSYFLAQELDPLVALRLSYAMSEEQQSYYKAFQDANNKRNKGELTHFVIRFLEFVKRAAGMMEDHLATARGAIDGVWKKLGQPWFSKRFRMTPTKERILDLLAKNEFFADQRFNIRGLAKVANLSAPTVSKALEEMMEQGLPVSIVHEGNNKRIELDIPAFIEMQE